MDKATWQLVLAAITALGVLWNAIQIDRLAGNVDELRGKVDTIETILSGHVNTPALHSMLPVPEAAEEERSASR